jgi:hypothetical protein
MDLSKITWRNATGQWNTDRCFIAGICAACLHDLVQLSAVEQTLGHVHPLILCVFAWRAVVVNAVPSVQ